MPPLTNPKSKISLLFPLAIGYNGRAFFFVSSRTKTSLTLTQPFLPMNRFPLEPARIRGDETGHRITPRIGSRID
jgi:hypothetical protein